MGDSLISLLLSFFSFSFYSFTEKQMEKKGNGEKGAKEVVSLARQFARSVVDIIDMYDIRGSFPMLFFSFTFCPLRFCK